MWTFVVSVGYRGKNVGYCGDKTQLTATFGHYATVRISLKV